MSLDYDDNYTNRATYLVNGQDIEGGHVKALYDELGPSPMQVTANTQTDNYTLALTDAGNCVEINAATAKTVTVPTNASVAFEIGTVIDIYQMGAGGVTIVGDGGVTVRNEGALPEQYSTGTLRKRDTNEWVLTKPESFVTGPTAWIQGSAASPGLPTWGGIDALHNATLALTADRLYWLPFYAPSTFTPTAVYAYVTSAGTASSVLRMGLVEWDPTGSETAWGSPLDVIADAGTVAADSTGVKNPSISPGVQSAGWYAIVVGSDDTPTLATYQPDGSTLPGRGQVYASGFRSFERLSLDSQSAQISGGFTDDPTGLSSGTGTNSLYTAMLVFS